MSMNKTAITESIRATAVASTTPTELTQVSTVVKDLKYNLSELPAQVIFGVADLKFFKGKVKILEFGDGFTSGFRDIKEAMESMETILRTLKLPLLTRKQILAQSDLVLKTNNKNAPQIADYLCVEKRGHKMPAWNFQDSTVLMVNNSAWWHLTSREKSVIFEFFSRAGCLEALPRSKVYGWDAAVSLANRIRKDIPGAKTYVLKAPYSSAGLGVFIVDDADLEVTLLILLEGKTELELFRHFEQYKAALKNKKSTTELEQDIAAARKWRTEVYALPKILVQEYCVSDSLEIEGRQYDPTMRIAFIITLDRGLVNFHPLKISYWKVPAKPVSEGGLRERTVSNVHEGVGRYNTDIKIQDEIFRQLKPIMIKVFEEMFRTNAASYFKGLISNEDEEEQLKGVMLALYYSKGLNELHRYDDTMEMLKKIKFRVESLRNVRCGISYCQVLGEAQLFSGHFFDALKPFTNAIDFSLKSSENALSLENRSELYLTRSIIYSFLNKKSECEADQKSARKCTLNEEILKETFERIQYVLVTNGGMVATKSEQFRTLPQNLNALKTVFENNSVVAPENSLFGPELPPAMALKRRIAALAIVGPAGNAGSPSPVEIWSTGYATRAVAAASPVVESSEKSRGSSVSAKP